MKIEVLNHASVKLSKDIIIYFDPYRIETDFNDASYVFITHDHYDHYDEDSLKKVINENTIIIIPTCLKERMSKLANNIIVVEPSNTYNYKDISFETISSYNTTAKFHPKEENYVGYNVSIDGTRYYVMGDTNRTPESDQVKTDICFVPIGGTYTMDVIEASEYINYTKPSKTIPIHYGSIVGDKSLAEKFKQLINKEIEVEILI